MTRPKPLISLLPGLATLGDEAVFDQAISDLHQDSWTVTPEAFYCHAGTQTRGSLYRGCNQRWCCGRRESAERFMLTWNGSVPVIGLPDFQMAAGAN